MVTCSQNVLLTEQACIETILLVSYSFYRLIK